VTTFEYDNRNHMTRATQWSKDPGQGGIILHQESYRYDVFDHRIQIVSDGDVTKTVYNGDNAWADFKPDGTVTARYLFGNKIDQVLAMYVPGTVTRWYCVDRLGTVREIADATGQVIDRVAYSAFGQLVYQTAPTLLSNRFLFTGREFSTVSGLGYYRARYYDPQPGRFLGEDPLGMKSAGNNLYIYATNNPTNWTDPRGEQATIEFMVFTMEMSAPFAVYQLSHRWDYTICAGLIPATVLGLPASWLSIRFLIVACALDSAVPIP
jgi:RHS repeat-associated protein